MNDISNKIRITTQKYKRLLYEKYIRQNLGHFELSEIELADIIKWRNTILGLGIKDTYCRAIKNQLIAILNHTECYYNFDNNPAKKVSAMGAKNVTIVQFWTKEEFDRFLAVVDGESTYIHFNSLF